MLLGVATLFGELAELELNENKETTEKALIEKGALCFSKY